MGVIARQCRTTFLPRNFILCTMRLSPNIGLQLTIAGLVRVRPPFARVGGRAAQASACLMSGSGKGSLPAIVAATGAQISVLVHPSPTIGLASNKTSASAQNTHLEN